MSIQKLKLDLDIEQVDIFLQLISDMDEDHFTEDEIRIISSLQKKFTKFGNQVEKNLEN